MSYLFLPIRLFQLADYTLELYTFYPSICPRVPRQKYKRISPRFCKLEEEEEEEESHLPRGLNNF